MITIETASNNSHRTSLWLLGLLLTIIPIITFARAGINSINGFMIDDALVPSDEIRPGGPPRDGIPAIDQPHFIPAQEAHALHDDERVLGLIIDGEAHAYPVAILNWHEIVNDRIAGKPIVITYCPLCGSGIAFERRIGGRVRHFGVSGLLYNSDVLLYDRESESLWSQLLGQAISGPSKGLRLEAIVLEHTNWSRWRELHPATRVLSRDTGYARDYDHDPYAGYRSSRRLYFPVTHEDGRLHPKQEVVGIELDGQARAWSLATLARGPKVLHDHLAGQELRIEYDTAGNTARIFTNDGRRLPETIAFWFAWAAFHPDTTLYQEPR